MAHLTVWCEHHEIPHQGVPVGILRKHGTGKGNADEQAMMAALRTRVFRRAVEHEGCHQQRILVVSEDDRRLDITERPFIRRLGERHYGAKEIGMAEWTVDTVAERFAESAEAARRLPPVRLQGYFNLRPALRRQPRETWGTSDIEPRPLLPPRAAIERMLETMGSVLWLSVEERHRVWMRVEDIGWKVIAGASGPTGPRHGGGGGERLKQSRAI